MPSDPREQVMFSVTHMKQYTAGELKRLHVSILESQC